MNFSHVIQSINEISSPGPRVGPRVPRSFLFCTLSYHVLADFLLQPMLAPAGHGGDYPYSEAVDAELDGEGPGALGPTLDVTRLKIPTRLASHVNPMTFCPVAIAEAIPCLQKPALLDATRSTAKVTSQVGRKRQQEDTPPVDEEKGTPIRVTISWGTSRLDGRMLSCRFSAEVSTPKADGDVTTSVLALSRDATEFAARLDDLQVDLLKYFTPLPLTDGTSAALGAVVAITGDLRLMSFVISCAYSASWFSWSTDGGAAVVCLEGEYEFFQEGFRDGVLVVVPVADRRDKLLLLRLCCRHFTKVVMCC